MRCGEFGETVILSKADTLELDISCQYQHTHFKSFYTMSVGFKEDDALLKF